MNQNGGSSGSDDEFKTVIRPSPAGRRGQPAQAERAGMERNRPPSRMEHPRIDIQAGFGQRPNALAANALPVLMVVPKFRKLAFHNDIGALQERLVNEVGIFQNRSLQQGCSEEQVRMASYFVCSLIDEAVLNTPWGIESNWAHDSLLVKFHKDTWGGEDFFEIIKRLLQRPSQNLDLLELAYLCLSLGFEGKFRLWHNGLQELEQLRQEIYGEIRGLRGEADHNLSVNWRGLADLRNPLARHVPLWVMAVVACLVLLGVYLVLSYAINTGSNRLFSQWLAIAGEETNLFPEPPAPVAAPEPAQANRAARFRELLSKEIAEGKVIVLDGPILRLTNAFESGSDEIAKGYVELLLKIAGELKNDTRQVEVLGHTDNVRIFTTRFPSNWHLSNSRAKKVAELLDKYGSMGSRITYKGRADSDPVAPNDTPEHRALNRRTDVYIR